MVKMNIQEYKCIEVKYSSEVNTDITGVDQHEQKINVIMDIELYITYYIVQHMLMLCLKYTVIDSMTIREYYRI